MKRIITLLICLELLLSTFASFSYAQSPDLQKQVDALKSKIASKVAELKLVEKKSILGTVTDSSETQITLQTLGKEIKFVDVDELTKFSGTSNTFGISDIKPGMILGVIGLYNKESKRTQARLITQESLPQAIIYGAVYSLDKDNFEVTVAKENGAKNIVEIDTVTKTYSFTAGDLTKAGFSKITEGETLLAIGVIDKANKNKLVATSVLLFPEIGLSPKIDLNKNIPTVPPSTGSGVKLQPLTK